MEYLVPAVVAVIGAAGLVAFVLYTKHREARWQEFATQHGLRFQGGGVLGAPAGPLGSLVAGPLGGLGGSFGSPRISGEVDGVPIDIAIERVRDPTHHHGSHHDHRHQARVTYTRFAARPRGLPAGLAVTEQHLLSAVSKWFGSQDIETGDAELDEAFVIKGERESEIASFLQRPPVKASLLELEALDDDWRLTASEGLVILQRGYLADASRLTAGLRTLVQLAQRLSA